MALVVKQNSWESLKRKLKQITKKTRPYSYVEEAGSSLAGMGKQLPPRRVGAGFASIHAKLKSLDEWLGMWSIHEHR